MPREPTISTKAEVALSESALPSAPEVVLHHRSDEKGRVKIPQEIRELLEEESFSYQRRDSGEVLLFSGSEIADFNQRVASYCEGRTGSEQRAISRLTYSRIKRSSFDSAGRFNLSPYFSADAAFPRDVELCWNKERNTLRLSLLAESSNQNP